MTRSPRIARWILTVAAAAAAAGPAAAGLLPTKVSVDPDTGNFAIKVRFPNVSDGPDKLRPNTALQVVPVKPTLQRCEAIWVNCGANIAPHDG